MYMFLPCPCEGAGITAAKDEDWVIVRVAVGGVDHREKANLRLTLTELISNVKQHPSNIVSLKQETTVKHSQRESHRR